MAVFLVKKILVPHLEQAGLFLSVFTFSTNQKIGLVVIMLLKCIQASDLH